ncbi:ComEA family DNA-binding protein [Pseudomonas cremoricolorata]|uniref:ComEA family DNA-binding protein n=1 Tax=Pseudomonas cremoricolorata TaxID=157783 RepID=UPI000426CA29|nr:helix-hairpin-helix domain-containing protein [Pseudomonas cremoricolorata]
MRKSVFATLMPVLAGLLFSVGASAATPAAQPTSMSGEVAMQAEINPVQDLQTTKVAGREGVSMARVDLNSADALTLQKELAGIGKAKAEAIVAYRDAHGPFTSVDELLEIKGIGSALLERNRDRLGVQ